MTVIVAMNSEAICPQGRWIKITQDHKAGEVQCKPSHGLKQLGEEVCYAIGTLVYQQESQMIPRVQQKGSCIWQFVEHHL